MDERFTGDLDQMVKRRIIRAGVTFNRTHYFIDKGEQRGMAYESLRSFEEQINKTRQDRQPEGARRVRTAGPR